jgi:hypothetical protein
LGTVEDGWGRLGTVRDGWGRLGTVWDGRRWGDGRGTVGGRDGDGDGDGRRWDADKIGIFTVFKKACCESGLRGHIWVQIKIAQKCEILNNLLVGIDVCSEVVVFIWGTEAYIGGAIIKITFF